MRVVLYRRSLGLGSGAAQLMLMQARGLRAAGVAVDIGGERGRLRLMLRSGRYVTRLSAAEAANLAASRQALVVDHDCAVRSAAVVFVHNLAAALAEYLPDAVDPAALGRDQAFFTGLPADTPIVANSALVRAGLEKHHAIPSSHTRVLHPGFDTARFTPASRERWRDPVRRSLDCPPEAPLIGLITSGFFVKRGIGLFLEAAERILSSHRDARFVLVGSRRLPSEIENHALLRSGALAWLPKGRRPEKFFAALDVMLYPAVYEEYGMVVAEAQAMGVPVVVSPRVGAAETLPDAYRNWGLPEVDAGSFAAKCLELLDDRMLAESLSAAALATIQNFSDGRYATASADLIVAQKERLK